jgi:hypothetical protein
VKASLLIQLDHFFFDFRPCRRIVKPLADLLSPPFERPRRETDAKPRTASLIGILIRRDLYSAPPCRIDQSDHLNALVPVFRAVDLDVRDLNTAVSLLSHRDGFRDGFLDPGSLVPHMGGVQSARSGGHFGEFHDLRCIGIDAGDVLQSGRETHGAFRHCARYQILHFRKFFRSRRSIG